MARLWRGIDEFHTIRYTFIEPFSSDLSNHILFIKSFCLFNVFLSVVLPFSTNWRFIGTNVLKESNRFCLCWI